MIERQGFWVLGSEENPMGIGWAPARLPMDERPTGGNTLTYDGRPSHRYSIVVPRTFLKAR